jgi:hypothetical protein
MQQKGRENLKKLQSEIEKTDSTILRAIDIKNLLNEQEKFRKLPSINILGNDIDYDSFIIFTVFLLIWIFLWYFLNINSLFKHAYIFFILYFIVSIFNIFNSANDIPDIESSKVALEVQSTLIQGGMGIFILVFIFLFEINIHKEDIINIYKILIINLLLTSLSILIVNTKNNSRNIRIVRKVVQNIFNMGVIFFMISLYMIFLSASKKFLKFI